MANGLLGLIIVVIVAFVPAILYMLWIRSAEIYEREPLFAVQGVFLYGMTVAVFLALVLETVAIMFIDVAVGGLSIIAYNLILGVILAPIIEEFTKATGVMTVMRRLIEPENGLVYGAAVGLGFAAVENVLYYLTALDAGTDVFIATAIARTLTSTLLHTSASALVACYSRIDYYPLGKRCYCMRRSTCWRRSACSTLPPAGSSRSSACCYLSS